MNPSTLLQRSFWGFSLLWLLHAVGATAGDTVRVSVEAFGQQASGGLRGSFTPSISADGRYVTFTSDGFTGILPQIYLHDRLTGNTTPISVTPSGQTSHAFCTRSALIATERYVAFACSTPAGNDLVPGASADTHIYLRDRATNTASLASVNTAGQQGNTHSDWPSLSADGRFVAFESQASNLAPRDTNLASDIFVHDQHTGKTTRVSVDTVGAQGNGDSYFAAISAHGRWIVFTSDATNLLAGDTEALSSC